MDSIQHLSAMIESAPRRDQCIPEFFKTRSDEAFVPCFNHSRTDKEALFPTEVLRGLNLADIGGGVRVSHRVAFFIQCAA